MSDKLDQHQREHRLLTPRECQELDARVYREVFGQECNEVPGTAPDGSPTTLFWSASGRVPRFSSNASAASLVKRALWSSGIYDEIELRLYFAESNKEALVMADVSRKDFTFEGGGYFNRIEVIGENLEQAEATALCFVALEAVAYQNEKIKKEVAK